MASQIEIDGQDDGEEDDGAKDEDQDAVLYDPANRQRHTDVLIKGDKVSYILNTECDSNDYLINTLGL